MGAKHIAYAVVTGDDPVVVLAEDEAVLTRAIALEIVARSSREELGGSAERIRDALLEGRWVDAVERWMSATNNRIDAYPSERIWDEESLDEEVAGLELRLRRLFLD
jgi:glycerol-3-phosphate cytidylyltransferase-like family protein